MDNYFEDLYRYVTSDTIVSGVSQTRSNAGVKNVATPKPTAPVKEEPTTEIEAEEIEQPTVLQQQGTLDDDVNALAQHYGILQSG